MEEHLEKPDSGLSKENTINGKPISTPDSGGTANLGTIPATNGMGTIPATDGSGTIPATNGMGTIPATDGSGTIPATNSSRTALQKLVSACNKLYCVLKIFAAYIKRPILNIVSWLSFCVCIALVPVLSIAIASEAKGQPFNLEKALAHGELLAISIALIGEAIAYLLTNSNVGAAFKRVVGAGCTLLLLGSALSLGTIASDNTQPDGVVHLSFLFFAGTLLVGCFCKWTEK